MTNCMRRKGFRGLRSQLLEAAQNRLILWTAGSRCEEEKSSQPTQFTADLKMAERRFLGLSGNGGSRLAPPGTAD